jgi:hypothetical protein
VILLHSKVNYIIDQTLRTLGVELEVFDKLNKIVKISVPKESWDYVERDLDSEALAKNIKRSFIQLRFIDDSWKFSYRVSNKVWTKEEYMKVRSKT